MSRSYEAYRPDHVLLLRHPDVHDDGHPGSAPDAPLPPPDTPRLARRRARPAPRGVPPPLALPRECPGGELARRLGVSRRTVRRDIDRLRELGYPVQATLGAEGGYRLVAGKAMPPLVLDDEEAVAIAVGLRAGAGHA